MLEIVFSFGGHLLYNLRQQMTIKDRAYVICSRQIQCKNVPTETEQKIFHKSVSSIICLFYSPEAIKAEGKDQGKQHSIHKEAIPFIVTSVTKYLISTKM